jgi:hypothetical protein
MRATGTCEHALDLSGEMTARGAERLSGRINNFFYKNVICIGVLWWYMIYCAWSST